MQTKDEKYASKLEKLLKRWGVDNEEDIKAFVEDAIKLVNDDEEEVEDIEEKEVPETEDIEEKENETKVEETEEVKAPEVEEEPKAKEDIETETHQEEIQDTIDTITKRIDALEDLIEKLADSKQESFGLKGSNQGEPTNAVSYQDRLNRLRKGY